MHSFTAIVHAQFTGHYLEQVLDMVVCTEFVILLLHQPWRGHEQRRVKEVPTMLSTCTTALRLFKSREVFKVSQKTLDGITEDLTIFVRAVVSSLEFEIRCNTNISL